MQFNSTFFYCYLQDFYRHRMVHCDFGCLQLIWAAWSVLSCLEWSQLPETNFWLSGVVIVACSNFGLSSVVIVTCSNFWLSGVVTNTWHNFQLSGVILPLLDIILGSLKGFCCLDNLLNYHLHLHIFRCPPTHIKVLILDANLSLLEADLHSSFFSL